jgi:hypothetical protein
VKEIIRILHWLPVQTEISKSRVTVYGDNEAPFWTALKFEENNMVFFQNWKKKRLIEGKP